MDPNVPIAIIGMSCRFSGDITDPEKLWEFVAKGQSAWSEIPASRFNVEGIYHPNGQKPDTMNVIGGHFLKQDIAQFDAGFFGFSSELAASCDPQFRMQLENTYEALESAGLSMQKVAGSNTSVFAGAFFRDYNDAHFRDPETLPRSLLMGVGSAMASNRLSHFFDLRGGSMTIDTGCSITLTALHQGCQSLRMGDSDMSIVGGANVILNPDNFIIMTSLTFLSESGRSYAFDDRASGYGRGEGSAVVILKRLDDALRDGDPIRAVIRGSGVGQDGKTETITTPSEEAQQSLIREVYRKTGLDPAETTYFEAHGTGTPTGDPIEARAIASVFQHTRTSENPLLVGSVKTNIGHTETASGLAGIIKVAMALEKGQIPPSINFEKANTKLHFDEWNLEVARELRPWPEVNGVRRASVNNFGYGGTNAHFILEDYNSFVSSRIGKTKGVIADSSSNSVNGWHANIQSRVVVVSAKDEQAALDMMSNLKYHLQNIEIKDEGKYFDNLVYTLGQRRTFFPWIAIQSVQGMPDLIEVLESGKIKPSRTTEAPKIGFVFTGQGAQWHAMGRELIEAYPVFKKSLMEAEHCLKEFGSTWSVIDELMRDAQTTRVNEIALATPLAVAIQIGLIRLLESWGIVPSAVSSHSSGEIAAAYAAGALTIKTAMAISFARGQLAGKQIEGMRKGGMIAVGLGPEDTKKYISRVTSGQVVVACLNSPSSTTVSGDVPGVEELEKLLNENNVFARRLKIDAAYHSNHMQALAKPYFEWLQKLFEGDGYLKDNIIFSSPTTGKRETSGKMISSPQHWVTSLVQPVQFVESFRNMCFENSTSTTSNVDTVIEVGPHAALSGPIQEISALADFKGCKISYIPTLIRKNNAVHTMQALACELIRSGYPVDMNSINFPFGRHGVKVLTDIPHYAWNHQICHWSESRINKAYRFRSDAHHDLLGSLVLGTNMITPSWRHIVRLSDLPWLRDHIVQSNILYPGAGYICMAIEAACQVSKSLDKRILGYQLRDINIQQGLVIPDTTEGVEIQLTLRPCNDKALSTKGWKEFQVYSVSTENKWLEHCKGLIQVDIAVVDDNQSQWSGFASAISQLARQGEDGDYRKRIYPDDVYSSMRSVGICHGAIFQNMKNIRASSRQSMIDISIADTAATMPYHHQHDHVIDPTTLDTLFQAAYAAYFALPEIGGKLSYSLVPRSIKRLYVAHNIRKGAGDSLKAYCDTNHAALQGFDTDIVVVDGSVDDTKKHPVIKIENFVTQSAGSVLFQQTDAYEIEKLATIKWAPDISFMDSEYLKRKLGSALDPAEAEIMMDLRRVTTHFINTTILALTATDVARLEWHHKKFYVWMKLQSALASLNELAPNSSEWVHDSLEDKKKLIEKVKTMSVNGEMVCHLGPKIVSILRREVTPLELMLEGKLLHKYYLEALKWDRASRKVGDMVKHFAHKNPRAKILEIGAGTGGTTTHVLNALGTDDSGIGPLATSYDFTDISSGFFEDAQEKFAEWKSLLRYKKLDIEQDPVKQGFENGTYDLIIAAQVLHATKNMEHTMSNVRRLLKPGGRLVLFETTKDPQDLLLVFGLLPGWWLSEEEERKFSPSLSISMWDRVLKQTGFSGVETEVHDCESENYYSFSVMMSIAASSTAPKYDSNIVIITGSPAPPVSWLNKLKDSISQATDITPVIQSLESINCDGKVCIFLGELDQPILKCPSPSQFEAIRALSTNSKGLLWITRGGAVDCENPDVSLCQGFLRTIRQEYAGKRIVSLDLDPKQELWSNASIATMIAVFRKLYNYIDSAIMDFEFADRDGIVQVPRYYKDVNRNKMLFTNASKKMVPNLEPFYKTDRSLRLGIGTPGLLDTLAFNHDSRTELELNYNSLEIEPKAFGLNFRDVMVAMDQLHSDYMGFECSGIVKRAGLGAAAQGYKVGDRVAALLRGHWSNLVRVDWTCAVHIPDDMSFEIAATFPMSYTTAYISLHEMARVEKGEKVLIHSATGGLGQAAIVLAKRAGAEIFTTVGTEAKRQFVIEKYGIQPDHIFSSRDTSFAPKILAMTNDKGVDIVLNTLAGVLLQESFNCVARFGRFIEIGKRDLELNNLLEMSSFTRAVSFSHIDLLQIEEHRGLQINRVMKDIVHLFEQNHIAPVQPVTIYPISDIEKTFRLMQAGKHIGKIVISAKPDDLVPVVPKAPSAKFHPDASYLIVGGVGGIGRSVCHWMVEHGARHLIVVSRNADSPKTRPFIAEMEKVGCKVKAASCDISNEFALSKTLEACAQEMPQILGVIQGAMVLQDSIVEQMTLEQYNAAVRPKVHGSWNLHQQLNNLDFFVMLSSLSGVVGLASQCNYAAGNTFEDALARYRTCRGLHGASIDIGVVQSIGYVAENQETADRLRKSSYRALSEDDVLAIIESAITSSPQNQMLSGLNGSDWEASGMNRDQRFTALSFRQMTQKAANLNKVGSDDIGGLIAAASSFDEAVEVIIKGITQKVMDIFMLPEAEVASSKSLVDHGVDSLVAVEMRNMLALRAGAEVSIFDIMQSPSITALSATVASKSTHINPSLVPS